MSESRMIEYQYDSDLLAQVEKKLGNMKSEAPKALKNALNTTGRKARTDLKTGTREEYTVKSTYLTKAIRLQSAKVSDLTAVIYVSGPTLNITDFKTTTPKSGAKASVKKGGLKQLVGSRGIKAFSSSASQLNGLIWQREGAERFPIRPLKSPSVPNMLREKGDVYKKVSPTIMDNLMDNVEKQVSRILTSNS